MRHIIDPRQNDLFDTYGHTLSKVAFNRLIKSWPGVVRHVILTQMPVEELGEHFDPLMGRPSTELHSIAGLLLILEFKNWTTEAAADAYMFNVDVLYALNLGRDNQSMTTRTIERYQRLFRDDELAVKIMDRVSIALVDKLDLDISKQRLDSTHVYSNMATFTRMMGVVVKRFLTQLKRHHKEAYENLSEELRQRYCKSEAGLFTDVKRDKETRQLLKQQVAEDLYKLIETYAFEEKVNNRSSYKDMVVVFAQQCDVIDDAVSVKKKTGGEVMQNPSDPDATYDGHKGPGYQVQLSETYSEENEVQHITCAIPEQAHEPDSAALKKMVDDLGKKDLLPNEMLADTHYGSDENIQYSKNKGVDQNSPVPGPAPKKKSKRLTKKQKRLNARRKEQRTDQWGERYSPRAGIEGTNSSIKRKTGLGKLRVRGAASMYHAILMRIAGWNILRAACSKKMQKIIKKYRGESSLKARLDGRGVLIRVSWAIWKVMSGRFLNYRVGIRPDQIFCPAP